MLGQRDACVSPQVHGARQVGDVAGRVRLGAGGGCPDAGRKPVFKGQARIVQVVFDKERCNGLGGAEGSSGLSGFGMKKRAGLGSHILEGEDGGVGSHSCCQEENGQKHPSQCS